MVTAWVFVLAVLSFNAFFGLLFLDVNLVIRAFGTLVLRTLRLRIRLVRGCSAQAASRSLLDSFQDRLRESFDFGIG